MAHLPTRNTAATAITNRLTHCESQVADRQKLKKQFCSSGMDKWMMPTALPLFPSTFGIDGGGCWRRRGEQETRKRKLLRWNKRRISGIHSRTGRKARAHESWMRVELICPIKLATEEEENPKQRGLMVKSTHHHFGMGTKEQC